MWLTVFLLQNNFHKRFPRRILIDFSDSVLFLKIADDSRGLDTFANYDLARATNNFGFVPNFIVIKKISN